MLRTRSAASTNVSSVLISLCASAILLLCFATLGCRWAIPADKLSSRLLMVLGFFNRLELLTYNIIDMYNNFLIKNFLCRICQSNVYSILNSFIKNLLFLFNSTLNMHRFDEFK